MWNSRASLRFSVSRTFFGSSGIGRAVTHMVCWRLLIHITVALYTILPNHIIHVTYLSESVRTEKSTPDKHVDAKGSHCDLTRDLAPRSSQRTYRCACLPTPQFINKRAPALSAEPLYHAFNPYEDRGVIYTCKRRILSASTPAIWALANHVV